MARTQQKNDLTIATLQRFWEAGTVESRGRSERPPKITEENIDEVHHVIENQQMSGLLQKLALFPEQQHIEL